MNDQKTNTTSAISIPDFGSRDFWKLYDTFCSHENIELLVKGETSHLLDAMEKIIDAAHRSREIHKLSRPDKNWSCKKGWLALRRADIQNSTGQRFMYVRPGDVITHQSQWDRDIPITHIPLETNIVSGYFLSGAHPPMIGLFMPLFSKETIMRCIKLRAIQDFCQTMKFAEGESREWNWY